MDGILTEYDMPPLMHFVITSGVAVPTAAVLVGSADPDVATPDVLLAIAVAVATTLVSERYIEPCALASDAQEAYWEGTS